MKVTSYFIIILSFISCNNKETGVLTKIASFPRKLSEVSGIAYGKDKLLYTIQDSGNPNEIVVLDTLGKIVRTINITNVKNTDWEDIIFDKSNNLYIGDFGNNKNDRKDLAIYKIDHNDLSKDYIGISEKISFDYPEQKEFPPNNKKLIFDVEAFFEYEGYFFLFTKNRKKKFDGLSYVYRIPNKNGHHNAQLIAEITTCNDEKICAVTSAAIASNQKMFVLLSHTRIFKFENFNQNTFSDLKMTEIRLKHNSQKEAVCFKNETTIFIADEKQKKATGNIYEFTLN